MIKKLKQNERIQRLYHNRDHEIRNKRELMRQSVLDEISSF